jgi:hypothetical protein
MWGCALLLTGDLAEARRQATEAMAIADETGQPGLRALAHAFAADVADALGDHEEAALLTQALSELGQQAGWPDAMLWYVSGMAMRWTFEGQPEVFAAVATQTIIQYPRLVVGQACRALALALTGESEELAGLLSRLPAFLPGVPVDFTWLCTHAFFALAQGFGVEDPEAAAATYERLRPYRSLHAAGGISLYLGPVEMALAVAARVMGDLDGAVAHHEAAAATIVACGAARARALNGYQWAVTLLARDHAGDRRRALGMAEETLAYCRAKGYATFTGLTEEVLAAIGTA